MENWKTHKDCGLHLWKALPWLQWSKPTSFSGSAMELGACDEVDVATKPNEGTQGSGKQEYTCKEIQAVTGWVAQTVTLATQPREKGWALLPNRMASIF